MNKLSKILFIAFIVVVLAIFIAYSIPKANIQGKVIQSIPVKITSANFASEMSMNGIIQSLPSSSLILLVVGNTDYLLTKGSVKEGTTNKEDIAITIPASYLNGLTNQNFCSVIQKANKNRDLAVSYKISKLDLAWKYSGMLKYKNCLGL